MAAIIVILLVIALPLGIALFAVIATESERRTYEHRPASKFISALIFAFSALLGIAFVFHGTKTEYTPAIASIVGIPATIIAMLLAIASHRMLVGRSKFLAALFGAGVAFLTVTCTSLLFGVIFAPDLKAVLFMTAFGAVLVFFPTGIPVLLLGAISGIILSFLSNRRQIKP